MYVIENSHRSQLQFFTLFLDIQSKTFHNCIVQSFAKFKGILVEEFRASLIFFIIKVVLNPSHQFLISSLEKVVACHSD